MAGRAAASRFSASTSKSPSGSCATIPFGMPFSRISAVSARVSMPAMPTMPRAFSHWSKAGVARKFAGSVMSVFSTQPRTPEAHAAFTVSMSSSLAPTLPIWGKVKVTICPA